ncbi:hypothetical protein J6590_054569 [Homalodisca vitripennis]|nr:hypothetical protein J6590_054569 [Homalodisca vitripennis]
MDAYFRYCASLPPAVLTHFYSGIIFIILYYLRSFILSSVSFLSDKSKNIFIKLSLHFRTTLKLAPIFLASAANTMGYFEKAEEQSICATTSSAVVGSQGRSFVWSAVLPNVAVWLGDATLPGTPTTPAKTKTCSLAGSASVVEHARVRSCERGRGGVRGCTKRREEKRQGEVGQEAGRGGREAIATSISDWKREIIGNSSPVGEDAKRRWRCQGVAVGSPNTPALRWSLKACCGWSRRIFQKPFNIIVISGSAEYNLMSYNR